jgi:hypothetical protein
MYLKRNAIQEIKSNQYSKPAGGSLSTNVFENVHALNSGSGLNLFENGAATLGESKQLQIPSKRLVAFQIQIGECSLSFKAEPPSRMSHPFGKCTTMKN